MEYFISIILGMVFVSVVVLIPCGLLQITYNRIKEEKGEEAADEWMNKVLGGWE